MIRGILIISSESPSNFLLSTLSDNDKLLLPRMRKINSNGDVDDNLKHTFSFTTHLGTLVADYDCRAVFLSHSNCTGIECTCRQLSMKYLHEQSDGACVGNATDTYMSIELFLKSIKDEILLHLPFPFLMVLIDGQHFVVVTKFSMTDLHFCRMKEGTYLINEFALTRVMENSTNESKLLQLAGKVLNVSDFSILSDSFKDISNEIVGEIHSTLCGWPSHCTGYGLTIVKMNGQGRSTISPPFHTFKSDVPSVQTETKPKKPVTGFNFFSKETRYEILRQHNFMLTNNQLNKVIGQKWNSLPQSERMYFLNKAVKDKERFLEDLSRYNSTRTSTSKEILLERPVTVYNLFIQQEKQYVLVADLVDNIQTKVGKHGGDRWYYMEDKEQKLYEAIRDANANTTHSLL